MRIVIDMQGVQSESRYRGIGRYSLSFVQALARLQSKHDIVLAMSGLFPQTIIPLRAAFEELLPRENIRVWHAPGPVRELQAGNEIRRQAAELLREAFLKSLEPDIVHVTSLFEGFCDDAVTSVGALHEDLLTSVTLYDLILLRESSKVLDPNPAMKEWYFRKLEALKRAGALLAISEASLEDARKALSLPDEKLFNVSTGCSEIFRPMLIAADEARRLLARLGIERPFILCSGSSEPHKNLLRLFAAFAQLARPLRNTHCLVVTGKSDAGQSEALRRLALEAGVPAESLVISGHVSDSDLAALYSLCVVTVVPSYYEGFGLPALEAMSCGAAVIGSNVTSIPETIGCADALFDPFDERSITAKIGQVLESDQFRTFLKAHGRQHASRFSWAETARRALAAMEGLVDTQRKTPALAQPVRSRPTLAYVSPLPPERTGIAEYSADLIRALYEHYEVVAVVNQRRMRDPWIEAHCEVRGPEWLRANSKVDRVLYHFGNSPFHDYMRTLMEDIPGIVVLHDLFLGNLFWHSERKRGGAVWARSLYDTHGYAALQERFVSNEQGVAFKYPASASILSHAQGVIVHSEHSRLLAEQWFGKSYVQDWMVVPFLRNPLPKAPRGRIRASLGYCESDVVICSFGLLDPAKLSHRLLNAFLASRLATDNRCHLVFVGQNHGGDYGAKLVEMIRKFGCAARITITGWVDRKSYREYLAAADVAVQLRASSRGETSATVLDCMSSSLATIVNAHGSMAELPKDAVCMLPDEFLDEELVSALEELRKDNQKRMELGERAVDVVQVRHRPEVSAQAYVHAIEAFHKRAQAGLPTLLNSLAALPCGLTDTQCRKIASAIASWLPVKRAHKQILLDISGTRKTDRKTGIERVARSLTLALIASPPQGYRIEPIYLSCEDGGWHYRYARRYTLKLLGCPSHVLADEIVEPAAGDIVLGLDISGGDFLDAEAAGLLSRYRNIGVAVFFVVFDLLPLQMPQHFPPGTDTFFEKWLKAVRRQDGALCISHTTAKELRKWVERTNNRQHPFRISWFHQGADLEAAASTSGLPDNAGELLEAVRARPTFLMVGTIEPRKGHLQALAAFEILWAKGVDVNLVIVGSEGWKQVPERGKRTIPKIVERLRSHLALGTRLFWLEEISDEFLWELYGASACLIAASEGEGFGLPLVEAARHKLAIIARDIEVFREVMGSNATYFSGQKPEDLARTIKQWLSRESSGEANLPDGCCLTWAESADRLKAILLSFEGDVLPAEQK